ncbi:MAG: TerB family tellurite resistance protein [Mariprofundaceae bacterium]|nr:TerB family tellurite resistance protein [Mariprofundaceae bacterium]
MLKDLKRCWSGENPCSRHEQTLELTVTKLMVTMMQMDDKIHQREHEEIIRLVGRRFSLERDASEKLLLEVSQSDGDAPRFRQLSEQIRARYSRQEVAELPGETWAVTEADGEVVFYEERYISRTSSLLGVSSRELREARTHC